jgi:alkylation response protein AidB-like acyl-CoA dehydrogenase
LSTETLISKASGGGFLLGESATESIFTPDNLSEEHRMIRETVASFMADKVMPHLERLENKDTAYLKQTLLEAAELGLLGAEIPEQYGGMELDLLSLMLISEQIAQLASWSVTYGAHTGIGTAPLLYFGSEELKAKYLPKFVTGELISSYALTENHSGSDALAARTKAVLAEDGKHYILNGSKMWITNGGFADVAMVFAKVDGEKFSCFLVETNSEGFAPAPEEKKMGLNGSSTTALSLDNVKVPVENLIGEVGRGHKVALNVLNLGRFKLGAWCTAASKFALNDSLTYAKERTQFGKTLVEFGAIQQKIGQMVTETWVGDAMNYRTAGAIRESIKGAEGGDMAAKLAAIEEFVIECSILKVKCSEQLDFVVDEAVQILGGYGFSREYPAERHYRDSRINRIFEGTNEINRLTITGQMLKRAMKGRLPLMERLMALQEEMGSGSLGAPGEGPIARERYLANNSRKATLLAAGLAVNAIGANKPEENHQEQMMAIADMIMEVYAQDSAVLRCQKLIEERGAEQTTLEQDVVRVFVQQSSDRVRQSARTLLADVLSEAAELKGNLKAIDALLNLPPVATCQPLRRLAARAVELGRYPF